VGLTFKRVSETNGRFTWEPVRGASNYVLFANGAPVKTITGTSVDLDIGSGAFEVTVAAENPLGMSPVSSIFPILYDVRLRACGPITASVSWTTQRRTDTQVAVEAAGAETITCFDPTPRTSHHYTEVSACSTVFPTGSFGVVQPGVTSMVSLLSRDELGFLGEYQRPLTPPPTACVCVKNAANPDAACAPGWDGVPVTSCAQGFNLETGLAAAVADADFYLEGTPDATNRNLTDIRIVAPNGLQLLSHQRLCEIDQAPSGPYPTSSPFYADLETEAPFGQTDSLIVRTKAGRYAKVSNVCNCPSAVADGPPGTGFGQAGFIFSWILAPEGATVFTE
jgi:hypothetical protein